MASALPERRTAPPDLAAASARRPGRSHARALSILAHVARRLAVGFIQWVAIISGVFLLLRILPANPGKQQLGVLNPSPAAIAATNAKFGLNRPLPEQLGSYLNQLAHGNLGTSWSDQSSILADLKATVPVTLQLIVLAFAVTLLVCVPLGLAAASHPGSRLDTTVRTYSLFAGSQPAIWWGLMFIYVFWYTARWAPSPSGLLTITATPPPVVTHFILVDALLAGQWATFGQVSAHLVLPVLALAFTTIFGPVIKMVREGALAVSNSEFMLYARATGASRRRMRSYLLRNSLAPVVTLVGLYFAAALGGSVIIETIFTLPGVGAFTLDRDRILDYPAVEGAVLVLVAFSLLVFIAMDVVNAILDPRVKVGGRS